MYIRPITLKRKAKYKIVKAQCLSEVKYMWLIEAISKLGKLNKRKLLLILTFCM